MLLCVTGLFVCLLSGGLKLEVIVVFIGREEEAWLEEVIVHPVFLARTEPKRKPILPIPENPASER